MHAKKEDIEMIDRLKKRSDFLRVGKENDKWISKILILQKTENKQNADKINFGITVSKKVSKLAVKRNKIRRRLKNAAYEIFSQYAQNNIDFVIIARSNILNADFAEIKKDLKWCLKRMDSRSSRV